MSLAQRLNRIVTLQVLTAGQDEYGAPLQTWVDVGNVFAAVEDLSGREYVNAGGTQNAVTTKITIRYLPGVVAQMRVTYRDAVYNIEAVLGQDDRTLLLMCTRGDDLG